MSLAMALVMTLTQVLSPVALVVTLTQVLRPPPVTAITDGFYTADDAPTLDSVALFDSEATGSWPCDSDAARQNLSEVGTFVRSLSEGSGTANAVAGRGCQLISNSVEGTSYYGWAYPHIGGGVADFNGSASGTGDPRRPSVCNQPFSIPMGAGKVRLVGTLEKPPTGLGFGAFVSLRAQTGHGCVSSTTLATYTVANIPATKDPATRTFDMTVDIPEGTRTLALRIQGGDPRPCAPGGNCGVYVPSFRMYASLGADAPAPRLPDELIADEWVLGGSSTAHGNRPVRFETDPVNTAIGNYVTQATDLSLPGRGLGLTFTRSYNSLDPSVTTLGPGWTHNFGARLDLDEPNGSVRFITEDGGQISYRRDIAGDYVAPSGVFSSLTELASGDFEVVTKHQLTYTFDSGGNLTAAADRNGNALAFGYDAGELTTITDSVGRIVSLTYADGRLASIAGPPNRTVTYGYDLEGRLATVTDASGGEWEYTYTAADKLETVTDPNDHVVVTNEYGADGRISAQTNGTGDRGVFDWDPATQTSTYTDANGGDWVDVYADNVLQSSADPLDNTTVFTYDADFNLAEVTDPRGHTTSMTYDGGGNLLTRIAPSPLSYEEEWTHTSLNDVETYTDGRGNTTTYEYDTAGNLTATIEPLGALTEFGRDPAGTGLLASLTDPRENVTAFGYDAEANPISTTSPLGHIATMSYDGAGRIVSVVDPRGNEPAPEPTTYATYVLDLDPEAYWRLGEMSGTTAGDSSGNGHHATYNGSIGLGQPALVAADANPSARFNGSSTSVTGAVVAQVEHTSVAWFRRDGVPNGSGSNAYHSLVMAAQGNGGHLYLTASGDRILYQIRNAAGVNQNLDYFLPAPVAVGEVHMYAGSYDGTTARIYFDGEEVANTPIAPTTAGTTGVVLGRSGSPNSYHANGVLDEVAIFGRALSSGDLGELHDLGSPTYANYVLDLDPEAYWRLGELSGATAGDSSGNGHHATYNGSIGLGQPALVAADANPSARFNGSSTSVTGAVVAQVEHTSVAWFRRDGVPNGSGSNSYHSLVMAAQGNGGHLYLTASGDRILYQIRNAAGVNQNLDYFLPAPVAVGEVHMYAGSYDGTTARIYFDGEEVASTPIAPTTAGTTGVVLGRSGSPNSYHANGVLDEVAIFGRALSSGDLGELYDLGHAEPTDYATTFTYDAADRLLTTTDPFGSVTAQAYDPAGNRASVTDANGNTTTWGYDAANRLTSVTDAANEVTAYSYDDVGNLMTRTDANDHVTTYTYDAANRLIGTTDPLDHTWTLTYDDAGNVATRTDANGETITFGHDELSRLVAIAYQDPATPGVTFSYDANGNLTAMADGAGNETYTYDDLNRLTDVTRAADVFSYTYDLAGNLTSRTYPDDTITTYTIDDDGRLVNATEGGATTVNAYDPADNLTSIATPNGLTARYAYDPAGRLLEVVHRSAGDLLSRFTYQLDAAGNRTAMTTREGTVTYEYDELDRLTGACWDASCPWGAGATPAPCLDCGSAVGVSRPADPTPPDPADTFVTYAYDPVGNRLSQATHLGTTAYAYDAADRLTGVTPPGQAVINYTYDANGNQLSAGADTFAWDAADRLVSASAGGASETYAYAGDGRRLSVTSGGATSDWLWDVNNPLPMLALERDGSGQVTRRSIYGLGRIASVAGADVAYTHHDGLGSLVDLTDASGVPLGWAEYQPFGELRTSGLGVGASALPFGFAGEFSDATGLLHLRARPYDPANGRFLSTDPVASLLADPYVGTYVYVRNNPALWTDPSGEFCPWCVVAGALVGGIAGGVGYVAGTIASGGDLDPGAALIAAGGGAVAGAACVATGFSTCAVVNTAVSVGQYHFGPGEKSGVGYVGAAAIGIGTARWVHTPVEALRRAGSPAVRMPIDAQQIFDYVVLFGGGALRSGAVAGGSALLLDGIGRAKASTMNHMGWPK